MKFYTANEDTRLVLEHITRVVKAEFSKRPLVRVYTTDGNYVTIIDKTADEVCAELEELTQPAITVNQTIFGEAPKSADKNWPVPEPK